MMEDDLARAVRANRLITSFPRKYELIHLIDDPDAPPATPRREERWRTEKRAVGKGGQGQVFLQTCITGGRFHTQRAVKKIPIAQESGGRKRYTRELRAITRFSRTNYSRHFVQSLGWYETKRWLCITMEYLEGGDLHTHLEGIDTPLSEADCRHITRQVLQGLSVMHDEGFTHGDVKPRNVLIKQRAAEGQPQTWWVKLADFGISKRAKEVSGATTLVGTPEYMAPELQRGTATQDLPAADIWAVGVMAFYMLTREAPFQPFWLASQYRDRPDELFPQAVLDKWDVGADCQAFVRKLMGAMPEQRPSSDKALEDSWLRIGWLETQESETNYDSDSSDTSSTVSSIASARSYERGLTTQISIASEFTATVTIRENPQDAESDATVLKSQTESLAGPGAKSEEENPLTEGIEEKTRETQDLLAESATIRAPVVPAKAPEPPGIVEAEPTTTQESSPKDPKEILAAIKADKRSVMVMPMSYDDLELVKRGYDYMPPFSKACQANDLRGFSRLDYDVEERSWNGQTPLSITIEAGWIDLAKSLIHLFDADVNATSYDGKTPLFYATPLDSSDTLKEAIGTLLKAGANIDHRSCLGQTALSWAAANGQWEAISSLLFHGADIEAKSNNGQSPLSWAAMYGQDVVVRLLVTKGADIESKSTNSYTPLLWSMEKGHESTTKLLLHLGAKLDNEKRLWTSSLFRALKAGFRGTIVSLLEKHPEMIEERNQIMQTPLGWAAEKGDDWSVELLIGKGANLEAKSNNGQTPLSRAVTYAPLSTVNILLQKGADIESQSYNGQTPLSWAAMYGKADLVKKLLAKGANIDTRSRNGHTPLDWAVEKGQDRVVEVLKAAKLGAAASKA